MNLTRRDFAKLSALSLAARFAPNLHAQTSAPRKTGYCVIGLGRIAGHFMPAVRSTTTSQITGLVSGHRDKAERIAAENGVPASSIYNYENFDEIAHNPAIDAVCVALPNSMHAEYTIRAAKAGKHVLCEKPMSTNVADAEAMIAACKAARVKLMIAYRCHYEFYEVQGDLKLESSVCVHGHTSTRLALRSNRDVWSLGQYPRRQMMAREEYCLREADGLVTPSGSMLRRYETQFPYSLPRVRDVIPHFLDLPTQFGPLPDGLAEGQYIAVIGRIEGRKGTDTAIRAFSRLADEYPDLKLVLVGGDSWRPGESVDEMIASCLPAKHRDRLVRTGRVPRESALRIIRDSRLVIHPSLWDNYPFAVMEAMALGAVCVVSNGGGHTEMIKHGQSGIVFQAGSAEDLADAARGVLRSSRLSAQLRKAALRRITDITSADLLVDRKIRHYERAIRSARRRVGSAWYFARCARIVFELEQIDEARVDELFHGDFFNAARLRDQVRAHVALGGKLVHGCQGTGNGAGGCVVGYGTDVHRMQSELVALREPIVRAFQAHARR